MRIFEVKTFARFARRERISEAKLREAVERVEQGVADADLGGGLFKQRVARQGAGKSGGYRVLLAFQKGSRTVFLYGFAKSDQDNIDDSELERFRLLGVGILRAGEAAIAQAIERGSLIEVKNDDS